MAYTEMVLQHLYPPISSNGCDPNTARKWTTPPPTGRVGVWVMINVDAAVFVGGLGLIVRDHRGEFLAACRQGLNMRADPELAKTMAVWRAIQFASELPIRRAIVASDCLSLVSKMKKEGISRSHNGILIQDIKAAANESHVFFYSCQ